MKNFRANISSECPTKGWGGRAFVPWLCSVKLPQEGHDLLQEGLKAPGRNWAGGSKSFFEGGSRQHISGYHTNNIMVSIMDSTKWTVRWFLLSSSLLVVLSSGIGDMWWWTWIKNSSLDFFAKRFHSTYSLPSFSPRRVGQFHSDFVSKEQWLFQPAPPMSLSFYCKDQVGWIYLFLLLLTSTF